MTSLTILPRNTSLCLSSVTVPSIPLPLKTTRPPAALSHLFMDGDAYNMLSDVHSEDRLDVLATVAAHAAPLPVPQPSRAQPSPHTWFARPAMAPGNDGQANPVHLPPPRTREPPDGSFLTLSPATTEGAGLQIPPHDVSLPTPTRRAADELLGGIVACDDGLSFARTCFTPTRKPVDSSRFTAHVIFAGHEFLLNEYDLIDLILVGSSVDVAVIRSVRWLPHTVNLMEVDFDDETAMCRFLEEMRDRHIFAGTRAYPVTTN